MSAQFEKLIEDYQVQCEASRINERAAAYYDAMSDADVAESAGWAEVGMMGLAANIEDSPAKSHEAASRRTVR